MLEKKIKFSYRDVSIMPAELSTISSRSECNPFVQDNILPIFTAPMNSVVNEDNFSMFEENGLIPILPRTVDIEKRLEKSKKYSWAAYSLAEFEKYFVEGDATGNVLIDIANGHMEKLYQLVYQCKVEKDDKVIIMVGNIANPRTYEIVCESGADFVRLGIGAGNGCITTSNVSIHYPMASLINEVSGRRNYLADHYNIDKRTLPRIIADGGIRNYSDVIKAYALGADYVMIGSLFSRCIESVGNKKIIDLSHPEIEPKVTVDPKELYDNLKYDWDNKFWRGLNKETGDECNLDIQVKFYGMASKDGQIALKGTKTTTSEGITKYLPVQHTLSGWVNNMIDYLKSAMSYTNCKTIEEFIGGCTVIPYSPITEDSINK